MLQGIRLMSLINLSTYREPIKSSLTERVEQRCRQHWIAIELHLALPIWFKRQTVLDKRPELIPS